MVLSYACLMLLSMGKCSVLQTFALAQMTNDARDSEQNITGQRGTIDVLGAYYGYKQTNPLLMATNVEGKSGADAQTIEGWVIRQWKRILSNARLVHSDGIHKEFHKNGDFNTALADFESLRPANVKNVYFQGELKGKSGVVDGMALTVTKPQIPSRAFLNVNNPLLSMVAVSDRKLSSRLIEYIDQVHVPY